MKIAEALQDPDIVGLRVECGSRWLVGGDSGGFTVYEKLRYVRAVKVICETTDEDAAVAALLGEDSEDGS